MKSVLRILVYCAAALVCLEILLLLLNPFKPDAEDTGTLNANKLIRMDLPVYPGLDSQLIHSKNSLGFRGPELAEYDTLRIFAMGGSTTECYYLSDGKDWPSVLGKKLKVQFPALQLNNAGLSGQTVEGQLQMLSKHILKHNPDYLLIMSGLENMGPDSVADKSGSGYKPKLPELWRFLTGNDDNDGFKHSLLRLNTNTPKLEMNDSQILERLKREQYHLGLYRDRLIAFVQYCREKQVEPVFIAQSILFSDEKDLYTNVYLGNLKAGTCSGRAKSLLIKMYNKITHDVCKTYGIPFINLAARLPKDSRFYYDGYHFTAEGAEMAASMLFEELKSNKIIKEN